MQRRIVFAGLALLLFALVGTGDAQTTVGVVRTNGWNVDVDTVIFRVQATMDTIRTPGFGGSPGRVDTFDFGRREWPEMVTVIVTLNGMRHETFNITDVTQGVWYDLPAPPDQSQIMFDDGQGAIEEPGRVALRSALTASPNPFAGRTTIRCELPGPGRVSIELFDRSGRRVRILAGAVLDAGSHSFIWDGRDENGRMVGTGVYLARLVAGNERALVKLILTE